MTVWKFALVGADLQGISMPVGATIIHVDSQGDDLCMWAVVDPEADREVRRFSVVGTGHPVPLAGTFIGSALMRGGIYVWHVFEEVLAA